MIYTRQNVTYEISLTTTYLDDTWISENATVFVILILISGIDIQHFRTSSVFNVVTVLILGEDGNYTVFTTANQFDFKLISVISSL